MNSQSRRKKRSKAQSLGEQGEMVLREAVAEAIEDHRQAGNPIAVLRAGRVVLVQPEDIAPLVPRSRKAVRVNFSLLRRTKARRKVTKEKVFRMITAARKLAIRP